MWNELRSVYGAQTLVLKVLVDDEKCLPAARVLFRLDERAFNLSPSTSRTPVCSTDIPVNDMLTIYTSLWK